LDCSDAWSGNESTAQFIAWHWQGPGEAWLCAAVNYAPQPGQCFVQLPLPDLAGRLLRFEDLLGDAVYDRLGDDLLQRGLYLTCRPGAATLFEVSPPSRARAEWANERHPPPALQPSARLRNGTAS
jgi:hypothetical protein